MLERDDFGGATSGNSLRILHGGLRYLQSLDLRRYRESVVERSWFLRHFPDQVVPLQCLMPLYGEGLRRPSIFALAFWLDALLSGGRNRGLDAGHELRQGRVLDPSATRHLFPTLADEGLLGGALWNDAVMPEVPRVLIEMLRWAASCGGRALNYTEALALHVEEGRVAGVSARDRVSGSELELRAPRVINCAGPWCREVARRFHHDVRELFRPTLAFNLLLDRTPPARVAAAVSPRGQNRSYFLVPWRDRLLAGTYYSDVDPERESLEAEDTVVSEFLEDLNRAVPELGLTARDVLRVVWGRLPAASGTPSSPAERDVIYRHVEHDGPTGLISASGVKFTTARALAERVLAAALGETPLPGLRRCERPPPARWPTLEELERGPEHGLEERLDRLITEESVVYLEDILLRRSDLGLDPRRGEAAAGHLGRLLEGRLLQRAGV